ALNNTGDSGVPSVVSCVMQHTNPAKDCPESKGEPTSVLSGTPHSPEGVLSGTSSCLMVTDAAGLGMVANALEATTRVGLDLETTGLDPRRDRVRLLSLNLDTTDGERFSYLVDCFQVDPSPLWEALTGKILIGHNLAFDLAFLAKLDIEPG